MTDSNYSKVYHLNTPTLGYINEENYYCFPVLETGSSILIKGGTSDCVFLL